MKTTIYKVECKHESKTFSNELEAVTHFEQMKNKHKASVDLWMLVVERTQNKFCITRELIAYSSRNKYKRMVGGEGASLRPSPPP